MKTNLMVLPVLMAMLLYGCTTKSPNFNPNAPVSASNPEYVPNTASISNTLVKIGSFNDLSAPVNPYAGLIKGLLEGAGAVVTGASLLLAKIQNAKAAAATAKANNAHAVATVLANNIPATSVQAVIESSPTPEIAGLVAQHLQSSP